MPNFLANIFETIASFVTAILVGVSLVASSALPANNVPATEIADQVVVEKIVEKPVIKPITEPAPKPVVQPKVEAQTEKPKSSPKTFVTPSDAIIDENGNILNKVELDRQEEIRLLREQIQLLQNVTLQIVRQTKPTVFISSDKNSIFKNQSVILTWFSSNATRCSVSGDKWSGDRNTSGNETIFLYDIGSYAFRISCYDSAGNVSNQVEKIITVNESLPRVVDQILIDISNESGYVLKPYYQSVYFLDIYKQYYFKIRVLDKEGKPFNDILIEMRDRDTDQTIASQYTNSNPDDWHALFSYTPKIDTQGKSKGLQFQLRNKGLALNIDFNTSLEIPKIYLSDPVQPKIIKQTDDIRHLLKMKIISLEEPIFLQTIRGQLLQDNLSGKEIAVNIYLDKYVNESEIIPVLVGNGIIKSGLFNLTLTNNKLEKWGTYYLRLVPETSLDAKFVLQIDKIEAIGSISGQTYYLAGVPIITPEITLLSF